MIAQDVGSGKRTYWALPTMFVEFSRQKLTPDCTHSRSLKQIVQGTADGKRCNSRMPATGLYPSPRV